MQATGAWQRQSLFLSLSHLQSVVIAVPAASLKLKIRTYVLTGEANQTTWSTNIWILFKCYKTQSLLFQRQALAEKLYSSSKNFLIGLLSWTGSSFLLLTGISRQRIETKETDTKPHLSCHSTGWKLQDP